MNTAAAARIIGIAPKELRVYLRKSKLGVGAGSQYDFTHEQVLEMKEQYWGQVSSTIRRDRAVVVPWLGQGGHPGLDVNLLRNPRAQAQFLAERKARVERLNARLHELGMTVPQMSADVLVRTGRALSLPKDEDMLQDA